jgi:putative ABC transport system permease protein
MAIRDRAPETTPVVDGRGDCMRAWICIRSLFRTLFRSKALDQELEDEVRFAVAELAARHARDGMPANVAIRTAQIELGGLEQVKERSREMRVGATVESCWSDLRQAVRALRRAPSFSVAVILTFGLGIGATVAVFTVAKTVLLEPLPYPDPDRLVIVWSDLTSAGYPRAPLAAPELRDLRERSRLFAGFGAIWANTVALTGDAPEQLRIGLVTANFFDVLGAAPAHGRTFARADEDEGAPPTILLSWGLWHRRFGGDPSVVGRQIDVDGAHTTVIGVMPEGFRLWFPYDASVPDDLQAWQPFRRQVFDLSRGQQFMRVVGRTKPGVSVRAADAEVAGIGRAVSRQYAVYAAAPLTLSAVGLQEDTFRDSRPALLALSAAVALLLALVCVNVTTLFVGRASARERELALRAALGASSLRLFRAASAEAIVLAAMGTAAGLIIGNGALSVLVAMRPDSLGRLASVAIDGEVLTFAAALAIACGLLVATGSALQRRWADTAGALLHGLSAAGTRVAGSRRERRARVILVGAQVAASLVLVIGAGLLLRTLDRLQRVDLGFDAGGTLTFRVAPQGPRYRSPDALGAFWYELREQLGHLPGVTAVGGVTHVPFDSLPNWSTPFVREDSASGVVPVEADARAVTPGYLETVDATLIDGRFFDDRDRWGTPYVAIVDERLASRTWPTQSAVGQRLKADPESTGTPQAVVHVVGVVKHLRHRTPAAEVRPQIYFAEAQVLRTPIAFLIRTSPGAAIRDEIVSAVHRLDPQLAVYDMRAFDEYNGAAYGVARFTAVLAGVFALVAFGVAMVGVYGVLAYAVARRQHEFAVRIILGARPLTILGTALRETFQFTFPAIAVGIAGGYASAVLLRSQLYEVAPSDPFTYSCAVAVTCAAAGAAAFVPAIRVARRDPCTTLRNSTD